MAPADSESRFRILFVCMGNICRSPAGECVMRRLVESEGLSESIECDSAGTIDFHSGKSPDARMQRAGAARGIEIQGAARQVKRADLEEFDIVLAMDRENLRDIQRLGKKGASPTRLKLFCDYCTEHKTTDVPDPYYGGDEGFETVLDLLEDGCANLLTELKRELANY